MAQESSPETSQGSSQAPSPARTGRRRQRSVRVTVAVALLGLATAAVLVALPTQSPLWLSAASILALVCGWAAARITYSELVQSRREAAADRAAQAQAYRSMFEERAGEHAEFTTVMTDRLARRDREVAGLEADVVAAGQRAIEAEARVQRESRRANEAQERVAEVQEQVAELESKVEELEAALAEQSDEIATWEAALDGALDEALDREGVADLRVLEERNA